MNRNHFIAPIAGIALGCLVGTLFGTLWHIANVLENIRAIESEQRDALWCIKDPTGPTCSIQIVATSTVSVPQI